MLCNNNGSIEKAKKLEDLKLVIKAYDETFLKLAHTMKKK